MAPTLATPSLSVGVISVVLPLAMNVHEEPVEGAVHETNVFLSGKPVLCTRSCTDNGTVKTAPSTALCVPPFTIVMVSAGGGVLATVRTNVAVPVPPAFVEPITMLVLPAAVGIPLISPVLAFMVRPDGSGAALQEVGASVAVIWYENAVLTVPLTARPLVIEGGGGRA